MPFPDSGYADWLKSEALFAASTVAGAETAFIQSSNPADILGQMKEGETLSPITGNVPQDVVVILRENMQYDIQEAASPDGS